ncbi:MAG: restriction endonuclease subunit R, partial [Rhodospirillales bacterium]|nr:restriction endonuclease subunit R [Rhodospirillales bacterium]
MPNGTRASRVTVTVTRKDGHHPIVFMQCGPVRFRASARAQARLRPFRHRAILRPTRFRLPDRLDAERPPIQQLYSALAEDEDRNALIFDDVLRALESKRSPLVLTERKEHALRLAGRLGRFARNVLLLRGGMGARQRREIMERLEKIPDSEERVLVAT